MQNYNDKLIIDLKQLRTTAQSAADSATVKALATNADALFSKINSLAQSLRDLKNPSEMTMMNTPAFIAQIEAERDLVRNVPSDILLLLLPMVAKEQTSSLLKAAMDEALVAAKVINEYNFTEPLKLSLEKFGQNIAVAEAKISNLQNQINSAKAKPEFKNEVENGEAQLFNFFANLQSARNMWLQQANDALENANTFIAEQIALLSPGSLQKANEKIELLRSLQKDIATQGPKLKINTSSILKAYDSALEQGLSDLKNAEAKIEEQSKKERIEQRLKEAETAKKLGTDIGDSDKLSLERIEQALKNNIDNAFLIKAITDIEPEMGLKYDPKTQVFSPSKDLKARIEDLKKGDYKDEEAFTNQWKQEHSRTLEMIKIADGYTDFYRIFAEPEVNGKVEFGAYLFRFKGENTDILYGQDPNWLKDYLFYISSRWTIFTQKAPNDLTQLHLTIPDISAKNKEIAKEALKAFLNVARSNGWADLITYTGLNNNEIDVFQSLGFLLQNIDEPDFKSYSKFNLYLATSPKGKKAVSKLPKNLAK